MDTPTTEPSNSGPLTVDNAVGALSSLFGGDQGQAESAEHVEKEQETPEAAAERIVAEEAGANQDADAQGESNGDATADEPVTVLVDGKPVQLTKEQIAEAHKGYLRQQDYTRKTMEAAEVRKAAEAETQKARAEREQYAQNLNRLALTHEALLQQRDAVLTDDLLHNDPVEYLAKSREFERKATEYQQIQAELQRVNQLTQQEQEQARQAYRTEQQEKLLAKLPEWRDVEKARAEAPKIKEYLVGQEFDPGEIENINDHRMILMARKAMQYDALMTRAKETAQKVAKAPPKVEAPGRQPVAPTDGRTQGMQRLAKSGKIDDAAAVLLQIYSK